MNIVVYILLAFVLLSILIGIYYFFVYNKGVPVENFEKSTQLQQIHTDLIVLFKKFLTLNVNYWIFDGTLLGAVRHQGIIPWDDDIDIHVTKDVINKIRSMKTELNQDGFDVVLDDHIWRFKYLDEKKVAFIDMFEMELVGDVYRYTDTFNTFRWPKAYINTSELFPLKEYEFENLVVFGPNDSDTILTRIFGDWRKPVKFIGHHEVSNNIFSIINKLWLWLTRFI